MPYLDSLDLANRACQHVGNSQILTTDEDSRANFELSFVYDKLRRAELRRNTWVFATKTVVLKTVGPNSRLIRPALWSAATLYLPGSIVSDKNGDLWQSIIPENYNNVPGQSGGWDQYFGPMTAELWTAATVYNIGDLAYVLGANSSYVVYLCLGSAVATVPGAAVAYDPTVTYGLDAVVSSGGAQWRSLLAFNAGNTPAEQAAEWDALAAYGITFSVSADDGYVYVSQQESNIGNYPPQDDGTKWVKTGAINAWAKVPTLYPSDPNWLPLYCSLAQVYFNSPIAFGVNLQAPAKNIFRLPSNYLRQCSRDPKAGSVSVLGAPTGLAYNDWLFQGDFLLTRDPGPLMFRFVADITVVAEMDDMFCEALAARMALGVVEPITGSAKKKADIRSEYMQWVSDARVVNGIEAGAEEPPEDDWIMCRL